MAYPGEGAAPAAPVENPVPNQEQSQPVVENTEAAPAAKVEELKEAVKDAKTPEEKKEAQKQLKKFKLKVRGEEVEEEIDLNDEKELTKRLQLAKVSQLSMQEKAEMEKNIERFIEVLKKDPWSILTHPDIGHDAKKMAQEYINRQLEEEKKSPEQREKEKLEKELKDIKEKYENEKKQKEQEEFERLQKEQEEKITNDIIGALESTGLPKSQRAVKYMAEYMALAMENNLDVSAKDIAPLVKQKMIDEYKEMLKSGPDELLEQFIDKDIEGRLQKKRVASLKKPIETANQIKEVAKATENKESTNKKKTITQFLNE